MFTTSGQRAMSKPIVIAFGYEARSGKGECCSTIYNRHSCDRGGEFSILRVSFGQRLRDEVHEALFTTYNDGNLQNGMKALCQWAGVSYDPDPIFDELYPYGKQRALLQWWGTEYRRAQNPDYWLDFVDEQIRVSQPEIVLIDDLRFPNEFNWSAKRGATVNTNRLGARPLQNGVPGHTSESALVGYPFDYFITARDGQLPWLRHQALSLFDFITKRGIL